MEDLVLHNKVHSTIQDKIKEGDDWVSGSPLSSALFIEALSTHQSNYQQLEQNLEDWADSLNPKTCDSEEVAALAVYFYNKRERKIKLEEALKDHVDKGNYHSESLDELSQTTVFDNYYYFYLVSRNFEHYSDEIKSDLKDIYKSLETPNRALNRGYYLFSGYFIGENTLDAVSQGFASSLSEEEISHSQLIPAFSLANEIIEKSEEDMNLLRKRRDQQLDKIIELFDFESDFSQSDYTLNQLIRLDKIIGGAKSVFKSKSEFKSFKEGIRNNLRSNLYDYLRLDFIISRAVVLLVLYDITELTITKWGFGVGLIPLAAMLGISIQTVFNFQDVFDFDLPLVKSLPFEEEMSKSLPLLELLAILVWILIQIGPSALIPTT